MVNLHQVFGKMEFGIVVGELMKKFLNFIRLVNMLVTLKIKDGDYKLLDLLHPLVILISVIMYQLEI